MSKIDRLIPFRYNPKSYGLSGKVYEEAEAHYYFTGEDLEWRLKQIEYSDDPFSLQKARIAFDRDYGRIDGFEAGVRLLVLENRLNDLTRAALMVEYGRMTTYEFDILKAKHSVTDVPRELVEVDRAHKVIDDYEADRRIVMLDYPTKGQEQSLALLENEHKHERMSNYDYDKAVVDVLHPDPSAERACALLEIERTYGVVTEHVYKKARATALEEPWVGVINDGFDPKEGVSGLYFELDWNKYWIEYLRLNGYAGATDEEIVDDWFADVCKSQALNAMETRNGQIVPFR